jgi:hypothetical protein
VEADAILAGLHSEEERSCFSLLVEYPHIMILSSGVLWCPAAKVGSTTIFHSLGMTRGAEDEIPDDVSLTGASRQGKLLYQQAADVSLEDRRAACEKPHVTFTMARDPFDRLTSAYLDKVVFQPAWNAQAKKLLPATATFEQFIDVLVSLPLEDHDAHTMPFSYRCGTNKYKYNLIGRLEQFDSSMTRLYNLANLGKYVPRHEKDASRGDFVSAHLNQTLRRFGLGAEVLHMHGQDRVKYFYTPRIKQKVANSHWKDDVQMFSSWS